MPELWGEILTSPLDGFRNDTENGIHIAAIRVANMAPGENDRFPTISPNFRKIMDNACGSEMPPSSLANYSCELAKYGSAIKGDGRDAEIIPQMGDRFPRFWFAIGTSKTALDFP